MDDKKNYELFPGKTLSNLFEDIYENSESTGNQVGGLVDQLKTFVKNIESAVVIVPLIREYYDIKVKSDEHLVKLSDTIQRMLRSDTSAKDTGLLISEEDKKQILEEVPSYEDIRRKEQKRLAQLDKQVDEIKKVNLDQQVDEIKKDLENKKGDEDAV